METIDPPFTTMTILIDEDSLATVESRLNTLECLIVQYGAIAFWGKLDAEPPRQTA
jgi:hypothetical protein